MNFKDYENTDPSPVRPIKPKNPGNTGTSTEFKVYSAELAAWETQSVGWNNSIKAWREKHNELMTNFKQDAIDEIFGNDAKKFPETINKLWVMAYEHGHSSGYSEIFNYLCEYQEIITAVMKDMQRMGYGK